MAAGGSSREAALAGGVRADLGGAAQVSGVVAGLFHGHATVAIAADVGAAIAVCGAKAAGGRAASSRKWETQQSNGEERGKNS